MPRWGVSGSELNSIKPPQPLWQVARTECRQGDSSTSRPLNCRPQFRGNGSAHRLLLNRPGSTCMRRPRDNVTRCAQPACKQLLQQRAHAEVTGTEIWSTPARPSCSTRSGNCCTLAGVIPKHHPSKSVRPDTALQIPTRNVLVTCLSCAPAAIRHECRTSRRLASNRVRYQGPQSNVPTEEVCGPKIVVRVALSRFTASMWIAVPERSICKGS